jgi:hypothetical protein
MALNLAPFGLPVAKGAWSAALDISSLRLDEASELMLAILDPAGLGAPGVQVAVYAALSSTLNPTANGTLGMAMPAQLPEDANGNPFIGAAALPATQVPRTGATPVTLAFSNAQPPQGTYLYFRRLDGNGGNYNVQVSGEAATNASVSKAWNVRSVTFAQSPVTAQSNDWILVDTTNGDVVVVGPATSGATWGAKKISPDANRILMSANAGLVDGQAQQIVAFQWSDFTIIGTGTGGSIQS